MTPTVRLVLAIIAIVIAFVSGGVALVIAYDNFLRWIHDEREPGDVYE